MHPLGHALGLSSGPGSEEVSVYLSLHDRSDKISEEDPVRKLIPMLVFILMLGMSVSASAAPQAVSPGVLRADFLFDSAPFPNVHAATIVEPRRTEWINQRHRACTQSTKVGFQSRDP